MTDRMIFPIEEAPSFWDEMHMEYECIKAEAPTFEQTYHLPELWPDGGSTKAWTLASLPAPGTSWVPLPKTWA